MDFEITPHDPVIVTIHDSEKLRDLNKFVVYCLPALSQLIKTGQGSFEYWGVNDKSIAAIRVFYTEDSLVVFAE